MAEFNFDFEYKAGKLNQAADALSRIDHESILSIFANLTISKASGTIKEEIRNELKGDKQVQQIIQLIKEGKTRHFWMEDEVLIMKGNRVYVPKKVSLRRKLIRECHDTPWAGHPGWLRTYALLKHSYYWPRMKDDVIEYTRTCIICQQDKVEHIKAAGTLQPLPIPNHAWESISLDFITGLPRVEDYDGALVVVDRFSKYVTFVATPQICTAEGTALLIFKNVVKY